MKHLHNQRGYALLLTIGIVVILTVLGISLLTLSASGIKKNTSREDNVQAHKLSQMGLEFVSNEIFNKVQQQLGTDGLPVRAYKESLENTLNEYLCFPTQTEPDATTLSKIQSGEMVPNFKQISSSTGDGQYCVLNYKNEIQQDGKENELKKDVVFLSYGTAGAHDSILISKVKIGTNSVPDHLNYVIGTNITSNTPKDGEGNLLLHGGVELKGDTKVEGDLIAWDYAYGGGQWVDSVLPRMLPTEQNTKASLVLKGSAYQIKRKTDYDNHIKRSNFDYNSSYKKLVNSKGEPAVEQLFHPDYTPSLVTRNPEKSPILITAEEPNYNFLNQSGISNITTNTTTLSNQNYPTEKVTYTHRYTVEECKKWVCKDVTYTNNKANYELQNSNSYYGLAVPSNLSIKKNNTTLTLQKDSLENGGTLYVGKNLNIGNQNTNDLSDKPNIYLNGAIYVKGDLNIQGAELYANALIYVEGDVKIKYSSVKGLDLSDDKKGSLVIFAKGNIDISNNSVNTDPEAAPDTENGPSTITGFFYSEGNFEMYGVGSNMIISGGVSAKRIVLNGIRGRSSIGNPKNYLKYYSPNYYWEKAENQNSRSSRLRIYYNPDIISTYSDLKQKELIITHIDQNQLVDQEIK